MKKLFLALSMIATGIAFFVSSVSAAVPPYIDVAENSWYYRSVCEAYDRGLLLGMTDTTFEPAGSLTRAQYVTIIYRIHGAKGSLEESSGFSDVSSDSWYARQVGWARKTGIVDGYDDGTFGADKEITRQELMVMTARYLNYAWLDLPDSSDATESFNDKNDIASWAADSVERLRKTALVKGDNEGNFAPNDTATRAEAATMIIRLSDAINAYDKAPAIGGSPIGEYSLYTDQPQFASVDSISKKIADVSDAVLNVTDEKTEKTIIFTVDDNLRMLEYSVKEENGTLTFAVYTRYALPYMDRIVESFFSERKVIDVPSGFSENGVYEIDSVGDLPDKTVVSFAGETDKNPLSYSCGDTVTYRVTFLDGNKVISAPNFNYVYRSDDGTSKSGTVAGHSGQIILKLPGGKEPGTSKLTVTAANKKGVDLATVDADYIESVVYDFKNLKPAIEEPDDFDEFWKTQMEALLASEPEAIEFTPCESNSNTDFDVYDVVIKTPKDPAYVHITVPKNAAPGSLSIAGYYGGYGFYSMGPSYSKNTISVSVNPHSLPNDRPNSFYDEESTNIDCGVDSDDTREECYFLGMIFRDIQAIRFAELKFADLWDGKTIKVSGGSMGGFQAVAVGALYNKVVSVSTSITWMCDLGGAPKGRNDGWGPNWCEAGQYFDSCYFAARVKCPVSVYSGLGDYTCPPSGLVALYNAFSCDKEITFAQNARHGPGGGTYSRTYTFAGDPDTFESADIIIKDNGFAVPAPVYGNDNDRPLSESEKLLKEATDKLKRVRWLDQTFGTSDTITEERINQIILDELVTKYSVSKECTVETDSDLLASIRKEYTNKQDGDSMTQIVEYVVYDGKGGHYYSSVRINFKKKLS